MAPLTVLSDDDVRVLLHSLTKTDILELQQSLADALHFYSTCTEGDSNGCASSFQPLRTSLKRSDGQTTLFMPASSNDGLGVKIVTLAVPKEKSEVQDDFSSLSLSPSTTTALEVPSESETDDSGAALPARDSSTTPKGTLTLLDRHGSPRAFVNAEEITAFRTALASTIFFKKRTNVHDVAVFGAGKQAYWHIRLALLLRGPEIHHLNILNRSFETAHSLTEALFGASKKYANSPELVRPKVAIMTPHHGEYERLLKSTVRTASVIFCTTPSLTPLFPASYLTNPEGRKKGRYIAAIGSYKPHMVEIHPDIIRQNVAPHHSHHHHKHAPEGGAIIVDSIRACLKEAGEIVQAGIGGREVVEIGELVMLKRDAERRRAESLSKKAGSVASSSSGSSELDSSGVELGNAKHAKAHIDDWHHANKSLVDWLQRGNVIYKSVGIGLMDVVVGTDLVRMADERKIGTRLTNF